jgi:hypothetical protein
MPDANNYETLHGSNQNIGLSEQTMNNIKRFVEHGKTLDLDGDAYEGKFDPSDWKAIERYLRATVANLNIENRNTGEQIRLSSRGIDKLVHRARTNSIEYSKTLVYLKDIIAAMDYISSEKGNKQRYDEYQRYLTEIRMDGKTYTILSIVGKRNGNFYYDQELLPVPKGEVLEKYGHKFSDVHQRGTAAGSVRELAPNNNNIGDSAPNVNTQDKKIP